MGNEQLGGGTGFPKVPCDSEEPECLGARGHFPGRCVDKGTPPLDPLSGLGQSRCAAEGAGQLGVRTGS